MNPLGAGFKTRPTLQGLQGTNIARASITARWFGWLARGWTPTALALTTAIAFVIAATLPLLIAVTAVTVAVLASNRSNYLLLPVMALAGPLVGVIAWSAVGPGGRLMLLTLVAVWPVDALIGFGVPRYRLRRLWAEFRRGFPIRYAILAAKSTRIQGPLDGEQQLSGGRRPILDHPALDRKHIVRDNTVWCRVSVAPGRKHEALRDVLGELAASFVHVTRIDLIAADEYQTFGWLVVEFGSPNLTADTPAPITKTDRWRALAYKAPAHTGIAACVAAITWHAIT